MKYRRWNFTEDIAIVTETFYLSLHTKLIHSGRCCIHHVACVFLCGTLSIMTTCVLITIRNTLLRRIFNFAPYSGSMLQCNLQHFLFGSFQPDAQFFVVWEFRILKQLRVLLKFKKRRKKLSSLPSKSFTIQRVNQVRIHMTWNQGTGEWLSLRGWFV